jgi:hypothetical protein
MADAIAVFEKPSVHQEWIARARAHARRIAGERGQVTINDVRLVCPPPDDADPRIMGAVFGRAEFVRVGFAVSYRKSCHGRHIGVFALRAGAAV